MENNNIKPDKVKDILSGVVVKSRHFNKTLERIMLVDEYVKNMEDELLELREKHNATLSELIDTVREMVKILQEKSTSEKAYEVQISTYKEMNTKYKDALNIRLKERKEERDESGISN